MKNLTFLFLLLPVLLSAQDYLITFSGTGESSTVSTVIVENLTQNKSLTLSGSDILHLKSTITEISDLVYNQAGGIQFYPNPMKEFSVMEFAMSEECNAKVELFDILGRKLTQTQNYMNRGRHSYRITGLGNGMYVLKVTTCNNVYSGKLISDNETDGIVAITYQNTILVKDNLVNTKSANSEIIMQYNTGDVLKFNATSSENKSVKVEVISLSKNIEIPFYNCTDPDKRNYAIIKIGTQVWMAENLAYLPAVSSPTTGSTTIPYYYVSGYLGTNVAAAKQHDNYTTYGVFYNWPAAMAVAESSSTNPSKVQGVCPEGWHLPSDDEWKQLEMALGMTQAQADTTGWRGTYEGNQMKSTSGWLYNGNGTNTSGFSALPVGYRVSNGNFHYFGHRGYWWSSSETISIRAWSRYLYYYYSNVYRADNPKECGLSVRCVRD